MKRILSFIVCIAVAATSYAQTGEKIEFKSTEFSFGKIKQHKPVTTEFEFTNNLDKPLIVESATAECGCTTPEYPKTPLMKGKSASIKVTYNAESPGKFTKKVTVIFANKKEPVILVIDGEVEAAK